MRKKSGMANDKAKANDFVKALYAKREGARHRRRVARPSPSCERGQGDVLIAWENEALLSVTQD